MKKYERNIKKYDPKRGASREVWELPINYRPPSNLENSELYPWGKYEVCKPFPFEIPPSSPPLFEP